MLFYFTHTFLDLNRLNISSSLFFSLSLSLSLNFADNAEKKRHSLVNTSSAPSLQSAKNEMNHWQSLSIGLV